MPFDFYLPKLNICIEYDGEHHFNSIEKWGGDNRFDEIKNNDEIKNVFCLKNNIKLIRIPYNDFNNINDILNDKILKSNNEIKLDILVQKLNIINDYMYKYEFNNYINVNSQIDIICPYHGLNINTAYKILQGFGCVECSKGEKEIAKYLDKNNISYYRQHKFEDCRNIHQLPFDFYIPSIRTIIEFDGKQHYEPMSHFGGIEAYERLQINDNIKNEYCEDNYIDLVRIKYDSIDNIESILDRIFKKTTY